MTVDGTCDLQRLIDGLSSTAGTDSMGATGCDPRGENSFLMVGIERFALAPCGTGAAFGADRYFARGMRLRSSAVVLIRTGDPISSSRDFDKLRNRVADRFDASLSFKHLKSAKSWVEGI
jgi:hypothetical protein